MRAPVSELECSTAHLCSDWKVEGPSDGPRGPLLSSRLRDHRICQALSWEYSTRARTSLGAEQLWGGPPRLPTPTFRKV